MESGDLATWVGSIGGAIGAIATVAALVWAVKTALDEAKKSRLVAEASAVEKSKAEQEALRQQAQRIYAWHGSPPERESRTFAEANAVGIYLGNSSNEPVYEVVAYLVWVQGAAYRIGEDAEAYGNQVIGHGFSTYDIRAVVQNLPPGRFVVEVKGPDNSPMQGQLGVEVAFTDRAGRHWIRRTSGELVETAISAIDHYDIHRPLNYSQADPLL